MQVVERRYYTREKYLELEEAADHKSEYIDGKIIPMAGGSTNHNRISLNFSSNLNLAFRQQNYETFMSDVRLWISQKRIYTYPELMIVAGEPEYYNLRKDTILNPQVIVEVLSKSSRGYDREDKFEAYRTIPTFQEYLLIDQTRIHVEQFSKTGRKRWSLYEYDEEDEAITLNSVSFQISLIDLYNKVKFDVVEAAPESVEPQD